MIRPLIEYFQKMEKQPSSNKNFNNGNSQSKTNNQQQQENFIVEIENKSTQYEFHEDNEKSVEAIQKDIEELKSQNENLRNAIEVLNRENSNLRSELNLRIQVIDAVREAHQSAVQNRNDLLTNIQNLQQQVKDMQTKLDEQQLLNSSQQNEDEKCYSNVASGVGQQSIAIGQRAPKVCKKEIRRQLLTARYRIHPMHNIVLKDRMDNLANSVAKQATKLQTSISIQEIRDKQNLQELRNKLEKSLVFPDTSAGRPQASPDQRAPEITTIDEQPEKCVCPGAKQAADCVCTDECVNECPAANSNKISGELPSTEIKLNKSQKSIAASMKTVSFTNKVVEPFVVDEKSIKTDTPPNSVEEFEVNVGATNQVGSKSIDLSARSGKGVLNAPGKESLESESVQEDTISTVEHEVREVTEDDLDNENDFK